MNITERLALKNRLIRESGLSADEWHARAAMEARSEGLELNQWIALGKNVSPDKELSSSKIFTDGNTTASAEVAASAETDSVTKDTKLSTPGDVSTASAEGASTEATGDTVMSADTGQSEGEQPSGATTPEGSTTGLSAETTINPDLSDHSAESNPPAVVDESAADAVSAERVSESSTIAGKTKEEGEAPRQEEPIPESVKAVESAPISHSSHDGNPQQAAPQSVNSGGYTDRTLEVIGKGKGGPIITEKSDFALPSATSATQGLLNKVAAATAQDDAEAASGDAYAEFIENHVSKLCQQSRVTNIDISSFGIRAQSLKFKNLQILTYGKHKFLGVPFSAKEEEALVFRLGLYCQQSPKDKLVIQAVTEVRDTSGFTFYSLLFTDQIIQKFVNATNFTVYINSDDPDVSKLVVVVEKCPNKNSILG